MYLVWVATSLCRTIVPFIGLFELMKDFFLLLLNIRTTDIDDVMHEGLRAKLRRWWALHRTLLRGQHEGLNCGTCGISDYEVTKDSGHDVRWRHSRHLRYWSILIDGSVILSKIWRFCMHDRYITMIAILRIHVTGQLIA